MPSGSPAEIWEVPYCFNNESIWVIAVRNKSSSRIVVACERKRLQGLFRLGEPTVKLVCQ